jgi:hypothetical protein
MRLNDSWKLLTNLLMEMKVNVLTKSKPGKIHLYWSGCRLDLFSCVRGVASFSS